MAPAAPRAYLNRTHLLRLTWHCHEILSRPLLPDARQHRHRPRGAWAGRHARRARDGLGVGIHDAGLLVTYGAVVLCVGSPVMAWLTTRMDRRISAGRDPGVVAAAEGASALAPSYGVVLALRLAMLAVAAIYTPQAAATVGLIVPEAQRPSAIAFVFLGWSLAVAGGLPLITLPRHAFRLARRLRAPGRRRGGDRGARIRDAARRPHRQAAVAGELRHHRPQQAADDDPDRDDAADLRPDHRLRLSRAAAAPADRRRQSHRRELLRASTAWLRSSATSSPPASSPRSAPR